MDSSHLIYFGTYTRSTSRGIYAARLDDATGALSAPQLVAEIDSPTWVTVSPDRKFLYAVHGSRALVAGYAIDPSTGALTPLPLPASAQEPAGAPCHLAIDATQKTLVAANYGDGYVAALPIHADGTLGAPQIIRHAGTGPNPQRQEKPHVHSVTISPDNRFVMVCDLGLDKVFTYALDAANARLTPAQPPFVATQPCGGPRHFKFGPDGRHAYVLSEMGSSVEVFDYDPAKGALSPRQIATTLPGGYMAKWGAEVRVHPNGKFLYASNRGHDSIAVFAIDAATGALSLVEIIPTGGKVPRNFALSPNGKWLVCGHQDADTAYVNVFRVDAATGRLTATQHRAAIPMVVCVEFWN
ncbi:lactonase family protein [Opitutus sp. ER46]|uniref:lactonase family protein n=1 Tax=Opitutus sp. ER46 TaxID=2161864 RepID=UPI001304A1C4|nr:lactonase family protein [Opitutus sp. ER46]